MTPAILLLLLFNEEDVDHFPFGQYLWITNLHQLVITNTGARIIFNKGE